MKNQEKKRKQKIAISIFIVLTLIVFSLSNPLQVYAACPKGRIAHAMAYDLANDVIIVYGGTTQSTSSAYWNFETWMYDYNNNVWTNMKPEENPYGSVHTQLIYDLESDKMVCFGGHHAEDYSSNDTSVYEYSANTWTPMAPNNYPLLRTGHCMAYDTESDLIIMHGGMLQSDYNPYGDQITYNDTWAYDYNTNTWTNVTPSVSPLGREHAKMVYDSESDRVIMFGGVHSPNKNAFSDSTGAVYKMETWAYDYNSNSWENASDISVNPDPIDHDMAYDSESDRIILFGGFTHLNSDGLEDETWSYDYNTKTWTKLSSSSSLRRSGHQMVYDFESDAIILFGGFVHTSLTSFLGEVWVYDYNTNTWTMIDPVCTTKETSFLLVPLVAFFAVYVIFRKLRKRSRKND